MAKNERELVTCQLPNGSRCSLEVSYYLPEPAGEKGAAPSHAVVLTHPYGSLGGNLDNNVVRALYTWLGGELQLAVLRFNFSGVGSSSGRGSWTGCVEQDNLRAAVALLEHLCREQYGDGAALPSLLGYSYGAMIAASLYREMAAHMNGLRLGGLVLISYPLSVLWALSAGHGSAMTAPLTAATDPALPAPPILFVAGDCDQFTAVHKLRHFVDTQCVVVPQKTFHEEAGADHFWAGTEPVLTAVIAQWLEATRLLPQAQAPQ